VVPPIRQAMPGPAGRLETPRCSALPATPTSTSPTACITASTWSPARGERRGLCSFAHSSRWPESSACGPGAVRCRKCTWLADRAVSRGRWGWIEPMTGRIWRGADSGWLRDQRAAAGGESSDLSGSEFDLPGSGRGASFLPVIRAFRGIVGASPGVAGRRPGLQGGIRVDTFATARLTCRLRAWRTSLTERTFARLAEAWFSA
jgi:hypothetical protein